MKTYNFTIETGYVGSLVEDIFQFEDDITEYELLEAWGEWVGSVIDGGWAEVEQ